MGIYIFTVVHPDPISSIITLSSNGLAIMTKRVTGIEPASLAWKARVLPLNYTRIFAQFGFHTCTSYALSDLKGW